LEACYDRKVSVGIIAGFLSFESASMPKHSDLIEHGMLQRKRLAVGAFHAFFYAGT